ncbi:hypothetical protein D3C80_1159640 [compost metagenome]
MPEALRPKNSQLSGAVEAASGVGRLPAAMGFEMPPCGKKAAINVAINASNRANPERLAARRVLEGVVGSAAPTHRLRVRMMAGTTRRGSSGQ